MKLSAKLALIIALAPLSIAWAADCDHTTTQTNMNACADQAYKQSDAELNRVYKQITSRLKDDKAARKLLLTSQRDWLAFRDAECAFATSTSARGSIYPMLVAQCRDALTRKRVKQLESYLHCQEGDMSCPVPPK